MLRSTKEIQGYTILAADGPIGSIEEFFFDDQSWAIRYAVVNTGIWVFGKQVLISPSAFSHLEYKNQCFPVNLDKEQIRMSPEIDTDKPVSRQQEQNLHLYFGWMPYWSYSALGGAVPPIDVTAGEDDSGLEQQQDPHLRCTEEVFGYTIESENGEVGHLTDFIIDDRLWMIRYAVIEIKNVASSKKVLVSVDWVQKISFNQQKLFLALSCEFIKNSPGFNTDKPVNPEFEARLYDYYGQLKFGM